MTEDAEWVEPQTTRKLRAGMFVAQVVGKSMEPRIPDGGSYTVKRYESEEVPDEEGGWRHVQIRLVPLNPAFGVIELTEADEGAVAVVAEVVEVLR